MLRDSFINDVLDRDGENVMGGLIFMINRRIQKILREELK